MLIYKSRLTYGGSGKGALVKISQMMVMMIMLIIMSMMRIRHFSRVEEKVVTPAGIAFSHKSWSYCRVRTVNTLFLFGSSSSLLTKYFPSPFSFSSPR